MKTYKLILIAFVVPFFSWCQVLDRSVKPNPGPAPVVTPGNTDTFSLPNGMRVFVVENHKVPIMECHLELDIKPELEGDMAGYRDMMSELLLGGTATRSKDKLNEEIDGMGGQIDASNDGLNGSGLKKYERKILELMADITMNAVIKQDELDRVKEKTISELESVKNDPDAMVSNVSSVVNFGRNHPYGEIPSEETVKNITLERCNNYYHTYFRPNVAYMAIVGDVTMDEVKPLIKKYFGKWQPKEVPQTDYEIEGLTGDRATRVDFIPNESAVQSVVNITYPIGLKPGDPDAIIAQVTNTVLGGGSQGHLFQDLREKHGWTYGAYSTMTPDELGGAFSATVKCRNSVTDSAIQAILDDMRAMKNATISDTALQNAINYLTGNFAIGLESPRVVAQYAINIARYHLPADYYKNYLRDLQRVDRGDIIEKSRKYFLPDKANIVVAGNTDEVAEKLTHFSVDNKIYYYDYAGNRQADEWKPVPVGLTAEQVLRKYINAIGGENAISGIKDIKIKGTCKIEGSDFIVTEIKKAPESWEKYVEMANNGINLPIQKMVFDGTKGYQEANGKKKTFTKGDLAEISEESDMYACLHPENYWKSIILKCMEKVNGSEAYLISAKDAMGRETMQFYDVNTGLLVKKIEGVPSKRQVSLYSDYREVLGGGGYKIPFQITEEQGPRVFTETVQTVDVNTGVPDSEFE